jgi:hypothetical protein
MNTSFVTPERPVLGKTVLPPPPLRRVNAFATAVMDTPPLKRRSTTPEETEMEEDLMNRLRTMRAELQLKQFTLREEDDEYNELSRKISAIESVLLAFRSWFRTG